MAIQDLGAIGLRIETTGEELAKMSINEYVRTVDTSLGKLQSYISRQNALSRQREKALEKEINDNIRLANSAKTLAAQQERASMQAAVAAKRAADAKVAADRKMFQEALAETRRSIALAEQKEKAIQSEINRIENLRGQYNRLSATVSDAARAQQMYDRSMETLNASLSEGIITLQQYQDTQQALVRRINSMGHAVNQFGQVLEGNERLATRWARGGIQQAGYQVNDFFIQIQSGTPFIIAFSQQFSQLVGEFGKWGAVAGAGVAIVGVLVSLYQNWHGATKDLSEATEELFDKFDGVLEQLNRLNDENLSETFGGMTDEVRSLTESLLELEKAASMKELKNTLKQLKSEIDPSFSQKALGSIAIGYGADARAIGALAGGPAPMSMDDVLKEARLSNFDDLGLSITLEQFDRLNQEIDAMARSGNIEGVVEKVAELTRSAFKDIDGYQKALDGGGAALITTYAELAVKTAEIAAALDGSAKLEEERNERNKKTLEEIAAIEEMLYENRLEKERLSLEKEEARKQKLVEIRGIMGDFLAERVAAEEEARKKSEEFAANYIRLVTEPAIEEAVKNTQAAHEGVRDIQLEMERILNRISNMDISGPFTRVIGSIQNAIEKARQLAASIPYASMETSGLGSEGGVEWGNTPRGSLPIAPGVLKTSPNPRSAPDGVGGIDWGVGGGAGGGGGGAKQQDALEKLMKQLELEKELLGVTESMARVYRALGEDREKYSQAEIQGAIAEIEAIEAKKRAMEQMNDIANTMESAMGDAFTSMVDGTKSVGEAFKDMARLIVQQLFDVLVVQQLVGSWNSTTGTGTGIVGAILGAFQANGGAWSNGTQIKAFANGGVVGSPTFFGMSGGKVGLMGEAGPEAIMPLKRGADGKLGVAMNGGGGDNVNITNQINIPGGADAASVQAAIAKAMPQIVEATKLGVIQARKRGGEMRRTFGSN